MKSATYIFRGDRRNERHHPQEAPQHHSQQNNDLWRTTAKFRKASYINSSKTSLFSHHLHRYTTYFVSYRSQVRDNSSKLHVVVIAEILQASYFTENSLFSGALPFLVVLLLLWDHHKTYQIICGLLTYLAPYRLHFGSDLKPLTLNLKSAYQCCSLRKAIYGPRVKSSMHNTPLGVI